MDKLLATKSFKFDQKNLSEALRRWKEALKLFLVAKQKTQIQNPGESKDSFY